LIALTVRLQACVQSLVFVIVQAATLFGAAGRIDIIEFWVYVAILAAVSALSLIVLDPDLMQERMRPGGRRVGLRFLPVVIVMFLHWAVAGLDRGRLHLSDTVPPGLEAVALTLFASAWIVFVWAMYVNRFFSPIPRIQSERGHAVITAGPYRFLRHPGYTAALLAAATSGIALGSWISTFIAPIALILLLRRTTVEDRMLQRDLPGYADYAARVRYRLVPGIW
jgi:protein-S-isoprenylcysteine O-methyltransferase Ste14